MKEVKFSNTFFLINMAIAAFITFFSIRNDSVSSLLMLFVYFILMIDLFDKVKNLSYESTLLEIVKVAIPKVYFFAIPFSVFFAFLIGDLIFEFCVYCCILPFIVFYMGIKGRMIE